MKIQDQMKAVKGSMGGIMLNSAQIPELKNWDIGETYEVKLTLEQVGKMNQDGMIFMDEDYEQEQEKNNVINGQFIVKKAEVI